MYIPDGYHEIYASLDRWWSSNPIKVNNEKEVYLMCKSGLEGTDIYSLVKYFIFTRKDHIMLKQVGEEEFCKK